MAELVRLDGASLTAAHLVAVAHGAPAMLDMDARERMATSASHVTGGAGVLRAKWTWLVGDAPHGDVDVVRAFVQGHCAGVGAPLPRSVVRATMAARVNVLATGFTGCRPEVADLYIAMLNADIVPVVPAQGSVGAAGSTALAHILRVAARFGGEAWVGDSRRPAAEALDGLPEIELNGKEALSLINGSTLAAAMAATAVCRARHLLQTAEAACALSFEVVRADLGCLDAAALAARRHPGSVGVAQRLRARLLGSELCAVGRRPDPFSVRCAPVVLGTAWDALEHVSEVVERELNGACDNPVVVLEGMVEAGNFHGAPIALAMDHLKVALTQVASMAERRVFRMTYGQLSGLPSFLLPGTGLNSGLMLAQYTAASLVSECKGLGHPASVDAVPTVQHHEDHVSMGPIAARGMLAISEAVADVIAIELLCAAQGLDFHVAGQEVGPDGELRSTTPKAPGEGTRRTHAAVRERVSRWHDDRVMYPDLEVLGRAVRQGVFTERQPLPW